MPRAQAVTVRLDHAGNRTGWMQRTEQSPVGDDGGEIDFENRRRNMFLPLPQGEGEVGGCAAPQGSWELCAMSRSAKRVNSASKNNWIVPVGP